MGIFSCKSVNNVGGEIMKRFFAVLILTLVIAGGLTYFMPRDFTSYAAEIAPNGVVSVYCRQTELDGIDMGNGRIVECRTDELQSVLEKCQDVDGISVSFDGSEEDVSRIVELLNLNVTHRYETCGIDIVCGQSYKINGGVVLDGKTVNVQIALKDGVVTVGSPLILGSY